MTDRFTDAYASNELHEFFDCPPPPAVLGSVADQPRPRAELASELADNARRLGAHEAVLQQADRLAQANSAAVVTGQQAGLLLGPGFTVSKTRSAQALAARLDTEDRPVVPVFWLASQDHDVDEVNHAFVLDLDEQLQRIALELPAGVAASHIPWKPGWAEEITSQLRQGRWQPEFLEETAGMLQEAEAVSDNWADFFAALFFRLFGESAPLLLDPARPAAAMLFRERLAAEITDPEASVTAINQAGAELRRRGFAPQLGRAHGATNLFILVRNGSDLPDRMLLRFTGSSFQAGGHTWSKRDLLAILDAEPGRITPAAGLRPVLQDAVMPSTAFVVGPGELKYLAQLRDVYRHHGIAQPTIWPRTQVTFLEPPVSRILGRLGLTAEEFSADPQSRERQLLLQHSGAARHFEQGLEQLRSSQADLQAALVGLDPTLAGAVDRHSQRVAGSLRLLEQKAAASARRRSEVLGSQFDRLRQHLLPAGSRQERLISPLSFVLKFGLEPMRRLYRRIPESGNVQLEIQ